MTKGSIISAYEVSTGCNNHTRDIYRCLVQDQNFEIC